MLSVVMLSVIVLHVVVSCCASHYVMLSLGILSLLLNSSKPRPTDHYQLYKPSALPTPLLLLTLDQLVYNKLFYVFCL
jgi:hypothetical protein